MAQLAAVTVVLSGVYKDGAKLSDENYINILAKFPVLVAMVIRNSQGLDFVPNDKNLDYVANFLRMCQNARMVEANLRKSGRFTAMALTVTTPQKSCLML